jgi:hypothetical protein
MSIESSMQHTAKIHILPTPRAVDAAWFAYLAMALEYRDNPERATDLTFCADMARAYRDWQRLYLTMSEAA